MAPDPLPIAITREELYEKVWKTPMWRLCEEFGLSGRGLGKLCERWNVPVPPRGLAKAQDGREVEPNPAPSRLAAGGDPHHAVAEAAHEGKPPVGSSSRAALVTARAGETDSGELASQQAAQAYLA